MASNIVNLDAIKARLAAATPGPWGLQGAQNDYELRGPGPRVNGWNMGPLVMEVSRWNKHPSPADVSLIEHAPADLTALIAEVERLRAEVERRRDVYDLMGAVEHSANKLAAHEDKGAWEERAAVVAWLHAEAERIHRGESEPANRDSALLDAARVFQRGEHRREEEK